MSRRIRSKQTLDHCLQRVFSYHSISFCHELFYGEGTLT